MTDLAEDAPRDVPLDLARARRWGVLLAGVWLFYLFYPLQAAWEQGDPLRRVLGILFTLAFAGGYLATFAVMRRRRTDLIAPFRATISAGAGVGIVGAMTTLVVAMCLCVGQPGTAGIVYVAVLGVICLPGWSAWLLSLSLAAGGYVATHTVDGWEPDQGLLFGTLAATLAMWGVTSAVNRSNDVIRAREENARLMLDNERNRFARDLHDILGHSLTVITVKAELAQRLLDADPERARSELADLERLSRDALTDVRRAVSGYRELTLPGELARARSALTAAGIEPRLPQSADDVPSDLRELFAWTVREGVTNVIRHSGARSCEIVLTATSARIRDNGRGPGGGSDGSGLAGLRERAAAVGATLVTRALEPGFSLEVVRS